MSQGYNPTLLEKGVRGTFLQALASSPPNMVDRIAIRVTSTADSEKYAWIGESPQLQEVTDEIEFAALSDTSYTLSNTVYARGLAIKRTDLEDDQVGGYMMRIRQLAERARRHPNKLLMDALINGDDDTLGADYTGESFFDNAHTARGDQSSTQDNIIAGTGTTTAQVSADINSAWAQAANFVDEANEPFHEDGSLTSFAIVAPPALRKPVLEALEATVISQTSNSAALAADPIFTQRLGADDANDWYFLNVTSPMSRPLVFQDRDPLTLESQELDSDSGFRREQYLYKARARYAAGYAQWQNAVKVTNS